MPAPRRSQSPDVNPLKRLASQTAVYGLSSILGRFLNYLLVPLYTYTFVPADYGVVAEFYAYMGFLAVLISWKVHERPREFFAWLLLLGAAIEFAQGRTGYRQADLFDMAANTAGIAAGLALAAAGAGGWCRWLEDRLPGAERA